MRLKSDPMSMRSRRQVTPGMRRLSRCDTGPPRDRNILSKKLLHLPTFSRLLSVHKTNFSLVLLPYTPEQALLITIYCENQRECRDTHPQYNNKGNTCPDLSNIGYIYAYCPISAICLFCWSTQRHNSGIRPIIALYVSI